MITTVIKIFDNTTDFDQLLTVLKPGYDKVSHRHRQLSCSNKHYDICITTNNWLCTSTDREMSPASASPAIMLFHWPLVTRSTSMANACRTTAASKHYHPTSTHHIKLHFIRSKTKHHSLSSKQFVQYRNWFSIDDAPCF